MPGEHEVHTQRVQPGDIGEPSQPPGGPHVSLHFIDEEIEPWRNDFLCVSLSLSFSVSLSLALCICLSLCLVSLSLSSLLTHTPFLGFQELPPTTLLLVSLSRNAPPLPQDPALQVRQVSHKDRDQAQWHPHSSVTFSSHLCLLPPFTAG